MKLDDSVQRLAETIADCELAICDYEKTLSTLLVRQMELINSGKVATNIRFWKTSEFQNWPKLATAIIVETDNDGSYLFDIFRYVTFPDGELADEFLKTNVGLLFDDSNMFTRLINSPAVNIQWLPDILREIIDKKSKPYSEEFDNLKDFAESVSLRLWNMSHSI
ncbi:MAG: hypothetical protein NC548_29645 [Lachnospiraceae bacterium]|nr:hypothetical protein [Lachnospiraceae bacterium]